MTRKTTRRPLTAVRLRTLTGDVFDFDSLDDFVRHVPSGYRGSRMIAEFGLRFQSYADLGAGLRFRISDGINDGEDRFRILEDLWGDPIPRERIFEAWRAAGGETNPWWNRRARLTRGYRFRDGPVPAIRCARGGGSLCRHPHTTQEIRAWHALGGADADGEARPIKARRKRAPRALPDTHDDPIRDFGERNWKRHRRTQYKPVDKTIWPDGQSDN